MAISSQIRVQVLTLWRVLYSNIRGLHGKLEEFVAARSDYNVLVSYKSSSKVSSKL